MRSYVVVTGTIFALLFAIHLWRMVAERHLAADPWYLVITVLAGALSIWAWQVTKGNRERGTGNGS
jgi:hypothetical protein